MVTRSIVRALAVGSLFPLFGCGGLDTSVGVIDTGFRVPTPSLPRVRLSTEDTMLTYPDIDHVGRDPFLTAAEQDAIDHPPPPPPPPTPPPTPVPPKPRPDSRPGDVKTLLERLHTQVNGIIEGNPNRFWFDGDVYEVGAILPVESGAWVVKRIAVDGIRVEAEKGSDFDELKFVRDVPIDGLKITPSSR